MRTMQTMLIVLSLTAGVTHDLWQPRAAHACGDPLTIYSQQAVFGDDLARASAIEKLRKVGPRGFQALIAAHPTLLESLRNGTPKTNPQPPVRQQSTLTIQEERALWNPPQEKPQPIHIERFRAALDEIAQQRNAHTSLLYWHTDLETAKADALRTGRPILSLRLLGKLTDEYSCANSRYFRTVLYANQQVSDQLRQSFVLHWSSERPVPVMTVDFGDGRLLKRTLTGNSAHYVLDAKGRPIDVLPGLYGPQMFVQVLSKDAEAAKLDDKGLRKFHAAELRTAVNAWSADLAAVGGLDLRRHHALPTLTALTAATTEEKWQQLAAYREHGRLDEASKALVRAERPAGVPAPDAMRLAVSKSRVETPLMVAAMEAMNFERNVALDTVRNEYRLHSIIHEWFASADRTADFARLNQRVYAELFLTPANDPWMGLAPAEYTGLEGAGLRVTAR